MPALYGLDTRDTTPACNLALDTAAGAASAADKAAALPFEFARRPAALLLFYPGGMVRHDFKYCLTRSTFSLVRDCIYAPFYCQ